MSAPPAGESAAPGSWRSTGAADGAAAGSGRQAAQGPGGGQRSERLRRAWPQGSNLIGLEARVPAEAARRPLLDTSMTVRS